MTALYYHSENIQWEHIVRDSSQSAVLIPVGVGFGRRKLLNPLPTIGNSLKKQKSLYKVLTPSIKLPV